MLKKICLVLSLVAVSTVPCSGAVVQWSAADGGNDHWYDYVRAWVTHEDAQDLASASTYDGMTGYLVTITSQEEQDFVDSLANADYQVGGGQNADGDWVWLDGPEAGEEIGASGWENFPAGEPDNSSHWADYILSPTWSSEWRTTNGYVATYVIEYSAAAVPLPASVFLLGGGLAAMGLFGRRRRQGLSAAA
ncbi:VPLPA-CTERM sorting domain-containing protein [Aliiruegeria sabulilitoris]|uniref:VPLPA-CTERM sorting domain-containing protein n=1 Tax=Aliiruegeria sabulilitoris TaxID=1510458 RepID=UPI00082CE4C5|nr:VPLPA-CTERM sorting domain-containing protein [Aliiruegeria sabulilitoris]NDR59679.1 VPLPA-CTERM sorting domain-containing protein [Pseudoruegeria sp. M32A2M]